MKPYDLKLGVPIDNDFYSHQAQCDRCATGKLGELCLEGAVLFKQLCRELHSAGEPPPIVSKKP